VFAKNNTDAMQVAERLGRPDISSPMPIIHPRVIPHVEKYASERIAQQLALYYPFRRDTGASILEEKLHTLRMIQDQKDRDIESLHVMVESNIAKINSLHDSIKLHQTEIGQLQFALTRASAEWNRTEQELAAVYASTSWRLTSIARRIIRWIRR
jgi:hypothetical protein